MSFNIGGNLMREVYVSKKLSSRFFVFLSMGIITAFSLLHFLVWESFTKHLLAPQESIHVGDLARMGYLLNSLQLRKTEVTLSKQHIKSNEWRSETVDIITFGDSFSVGGGGGVNPYYQDFIVTNNNLSVLNIERDSKRSDEEYLDELIGMINGGIFDHLKPKIVIVESVERLALSRLSKDVDWNTTTSSSDVIKMMQTKPPHEKTIDTPIINSGNYKFFLYNFYYQFSHNAFGRSSVHRYTLNRKLFESKTPDTLLFYNQDITSLGMVNQKNVEKMNDNLNHLADLLAARNIRLVFIPAIDKYDLYYKYIVNNPYEENHFFELLRSMPKSYYFVDTKTILEPMVDRNITDVFYGDDTHWSYKASEAVVQSIPFQQFLSSNSSK